MKKIYGFTLVEIIIVLIVIGILSTIAVNQYNISIEDSRARVCRINQQAILQAVDAFTYENDMMPATLSQLPEKTLKNAWAKILQEEGWSINIAYFISDWSQRGLAYAQISGPWMQRHIGDMKVLHCPADRSGAASSYCIASGAHNYTQFRALPGAVVYDCLIGGAVANTRHAFGGFSGNHYGIGVNATGHPVNCTGSNAASCH